MTNLIRSQRKHQLPNRSQGSRDCKIPNLNQNGQRYFHAFNTQMYCTDCKDAGLSNTFTIGCQTFLTDNIQKHIKTTDHKRAIQTKAMKQTWNQAVATANKQHEAEIITAMNNIYWMAKTNQPISLFLSVNELLEHHVQYIEYVVVLFFR